MSVVTPALVLPAGFRVSVAPMMDWTDRHCRSFHRLLSRRAWLYTEMVTAQAIAHGDLDHLLGRGEEGDRVVLQLGGNDPQLLARAAREGQAYGYDEINLNCGCPSDRVREGAFGACLMAEPERVADCVAAMQAVVQVPVTVKHRIGIDRREDYEFVHRFVDVVAAAGCRRFVVHARNAWLDGLDPKQNREIPPLRYEVVHRLAQDFPHCAFELNGGLQDLAHGLAAVCPTEASGLDSGTASEGLPVTDATTGTEADSPATRLVGAMYGRRAYHDPWLLAGVDDWLARHAAEAPVTDAAQPLTRAAVVEALVGYLERGAARGVEVRHLARHVLGLYLGQPAARLWRRMLSESRALSRNDPGLLREACAAVEAEVARVAASALSGRS
ncbi:MAG: tRNA dihydrouridine(20/20a) synthase DusA [Lautropia mirabilis]|jgi:TIM-barrel protein, yjbN family